MRFLYGIVSCFVAAILLGYAGTVFAQCGLYEVPIERRMTDAELVFEGWVVESKCRWNQDQSLISTLHKVEISAIYKGTTSSRALWLEVPGGEISLTAHRISPAFEIASGTVGMLLLSAPHDEVDGLPVCRSVAYSQGLIAYDRESGKALGPFDSYESIQVLHDELQRLSGQLPKRIQALPAKTKSGIVKGDAAETLVTPVISGFSPSTTTAGTGSVLTISGSGFGSSFSALSRVAFANADNGGQSFNSVASSDIRSWSDSQIQVVVPSRAGTGRVQVTNSSGITATSSWTLTVNYALLNYSNFFLGVTAPADLHDQDGAGGWAFRLNATFAQNSSAVAAFKRALESWRCGSGVRFNLSSQTTSTSCAADDGVNVINFDNQCLLSNGVLAATFTRVSGCFVGNTLYWQVKDIDILFSSRINWNYGPSATTSGRYDFETVAVHELGHAHQLGHVIAPGKVMHYAVSSNFDQRALDASSDISGGLNVVQRAESRSYCGTRAMRRLSGSECRLEGGNSLPPVASFQTDRTTGCSPLAVRFFDFSSNGPNAWEWDVNNDGFTDYTQQNPTHTYTTPGNYSVRLTVRNSAGAATTTRWFLITVSSGGSFSVNPTSASVCASSSVSLMASGASSYAWTPALNASASNAIYTLAPSQSQTFTVTALFSNGCSSTRTVDVNVLPLPTVQATTTNATSQLATNGTILAAGSGGTAPYSFRLNFANWTSSSSYTGLRSGSYTLGIRDANGCENQTTVQVGVSSTSCETPSQLSCSSVTTGSALLSWGTVQGATQYRLFYRRSNDSGFNLIQVGGASWNLTGLNAGTTYFWYVQAVCSDQQTSSASQTFSFLTQSAANLPCAAPTPAFSQIGSSSATISWTFQSNAIAWQVYYRPTSASSWFTLWIYSPSTSATLTGLLASTRYEVYIRTDCGASGVSGFSGPHYFDTQSSPAAACSMPSTFSASPFSTGAIVSWSAVTGATLYRLRWRDVNSFNSVSATIHAPATSYSIFNLTPNRSYELTLTAECGLQTSSSRSLFISTTSAKESAIAFQNDGRGLSVFPNPGSGSCVASLPDHPNAEGASLRLYDMTGRLIAQPEISGLTEIQLTGISSGVYLLEWRSGSRVQRVKWISQ